MLDLYKEISPIISMKVSLLAVICLSVIVVLVSGCTEKFNNNTPNNNQTPVIINNRSSVGILGSVVSANNQFAMDLYSKYKSKDGNVFFSPYSISSALAMTYEGAKGQTADEMQRVLHLPDSKDKIRSDFASIYSGLNKADKPYNLTTANALWAQKDYPFLNDYLSAVGLYYDGKVTNLDFQSDPESSRITINRWVENKTNDRIKDLIPAGLITPDTKLVLTNAIYFKANWSEQFDSDLTTNQSFKLDSGTTINSSMMYQTETFNYGETNSLQILEMPYLGNDISMLIILPKGNSLNELENAINTTNLDNWKRDMNSEEVRVSLPKFKFETKYFMANDLEEMGMPTAFSDAADFSGMTGKKDLKIDQVIHQTFVEVSESGTEAAAATAVIMMPTAMPPGPEPQPKVFNADHPFIFVIQEKSTGNILFMGRVMNPA